MKKLFSVLLITAVSASPLPVHAEMERIIVDCDRGVCFDWWPKLPEISGWTHDRDTSLRYSFNAQLPEGQSFDQADAVIYAKAIFKLQHRQYKTLQDLIEHDKHRYQASFPEIEITEQDDLVTADQHPLTVYDFLAPRHHTWERVAYGEENNFFLIFSVSASSKQAFDKYKTDFKEFINNYKR